MRAKGEPRYLQIVSMLEAAIGNGQLHAGERLPAQRELARALKVDLTTVTRAYATAHERKLIEARGPHGTFVSTPPVESIAPLDLSMNIPPPPEGIDFGELLRHGTSRILLHSDSNLLMTYHLSGGSAADRRAGAAWLKPVLAGAEPARTVVCPGAQSALAALILALTTHGETLLTESHIYPGMKVAADKLGRVLHAVPTDDEGMSVIGLEAAIQATGARVVYINPTLQNPTAITMSMRRRRAIGNLAKRYDLRIIEDDPYSLLVEKPLAPLASIVPSHCYYLATLSKCLSPGLRTAFLVLPTRDAVAGFLETLRSFELMSPPIVTALVTSWIEDGTAAGLLHAIRVEASARQKMAANALATLETMPASTQEGIHIWYPMPKHWSADAFAQVALAEGGVSVMPSTAFLVGGSPVEAIRISLGGGHDRAALRQALAYLATLLRQRPPRSSR